MMATVDEYKKRRNGRRSRTQVPSPYTVVKADEAFMLTYTIILYTYVADQQSVTGDLKNSVQPKKGTQKTITKNNARTSS
jgi:hypothetical protein